MNVTGMRQRLQESPHVAAVAWTRSQGWRGECTSLGLSHDSLPPSSRSFKCGACLRGDRSRG